MNEDLISQIVVTPLDCISVSGGNVMHGLKSSEPTYSGFGEAYFSWINPKVIKAWKMHSKMTMNLVVPIGNVRFVFLQAEGRMEQNHRDIEIGQSNYSRITVPPGIWFGFQNEDEQASLVLNLGNIEHNPNEVIKLPIQTFEFDWNRN